MIELAAVTKRYDTTFAVDRLDLQIPEQGLFGLIGPNGAGKTTTLKMLATLIKPDEGEIRIDGRDLCADVRELRREIGYMPDNFGTFRGLTCREYLRYFGQCHGLAGASLEGRVDDVLQLTDMQGRADELCSGLSLGLRQRLSLAKTLMHDPRLLLLDEPASGLDPRARIEIRMFLKELSGMGKTIVISSHILADLEDICSEVALIDHGKVVWQGPPGSVGDSEAGDTQHLELRVPQEQLAAAQAMVAAIEGVRELELGRASLACELPAAAANPLLGRLVAEGIEVLHFARKGHRLEDLFLSRTNQSLDREADGNV